MKDIIDLGNLVFDQLVKAHGELPESRTLFLYGITTGSDWVVLGTQKTVMIDKTGVTKNFEDPIIDSHHASWLEMTKRAEVSKAQEVLSKIKREDRLKDGDIIEFGKSSGEWREINFNL